MEIEFSASESSFAPSRDSSHFEDTKSGDAEMTVEDMIKSLERRQLKSQQLQYVNGLFPQIYNEVCLNILSATNSNMSLWPHRPCYMPKYVDILAKTHFNPLHSPEYNSILHNILSGDLEAVALKEKMIKDISTLLLLKMSQLYQCLVDLRVALLKSRKKLLAHAFMYRPLDAADSLYCFLLVCGYMPSSLLTYHVSRHLRIFQSDALDPFKMISHLSGKLLEKQLISIHLEDMIPFLYNCLRLNDMLHCQISCYESKIVFTQ